MRNLVLAPVALLLSFSTADASPCRSESFEDAEYTVCSFDLAKDDIRLFLRKKDGAPYGTFSALVEELEKDGARLAFAMNGGMYREDFSPVGLHVENGEELKAANTADSPPEVKPVPNFYKKPNGVFFIGEDGAGAMETGRYLGARPKTRFATQSGPMLLLDGAIHPAFIAGSTDLKQRNGVGVSSPTDVHLVISEDSVNFHDFARLFREKLGCRDALFLDGGSAPGIYAPELGRDDPPGHDGYGPIIGVVTGVE